MCAGKRKGEEEKEKGNIGAKWSKKTEESEDEEGMGILFVCCCCCVRVRVCMCVCAACESCVGLREMCGKQRKGEEEREKGTIAKRRERAEESEDEGMGLFVWVCALVPVCHSCMFTRSHASFGPFQ